MVLESFWLVIKGGVGLEDNIWYDPGRSRLATNADLVRRVHSMAEANERKVMAPGKIRKLLNLQEGDGKYGRLYN